MVYVTSHDLRSPLVNIQGFSSELAHACETIREACESDADGNGLKQRVLPCVQTEIPEALKYIRSGVTKMEALLSGLLKLSRLGRVELNVQPLDMTGMIEDILGLVDYQLKQANMEAVMHPMPNCVGDEVQLNQVFSNLIDNAIKYRNPDRRGRIEVSGRIDGETAVYEVSDNGIGIEPDYLETVFEIFHRLDPRLETGEGLGLTVARRILDRHNGSISVRSTRGEGSVFIVRLPVIKG
jgi:signal transduction histidine kinase